MDLGSDIARKTIYKLRETFESLSSIQAMEIYLDGCAALIIVHPHDSIKSECEELPSRSLSPRNFRYARSNREEDDFSVEICFRRDL